MVNANFTQKYKWGEWSLDGCMREEYFNDAPIERGICQYLKDNFDPIIQHAIHVIVFLPFILMFFAIITNIIFIFICILVLRDKCNSRRKLCVFLLTRSVTIVIAQVMGYICLIKMDSRAQIIIFVLPESLYAIANSGICIILSIFIVLSTFKENWDYKNVTIKECLILNGIIWLFSIAFLIIFELCGSFFLLFTKDEKSCYFYNCEKVFAYVLAVVYFVLFASILQLIAVFAIALIKINFYITKEKEYLIHGKQYTVITRRFIYNITVFILTKIPFLFFCLMFLRTAAEIDENSGYDIAVRFEVFVNLSLNAAVAEMVIDPIFTIATNYKMISKLVKKVFFKQPRSRVVSMKRNFSFKDNLKDKINTFF